MPRQDTALAEPASRAPRRAFTEQPIEPLSRLRGEVDRLFDDFPLRFPPFDGGPAAPAIEMTETDTAYKITAELPGIVREDIEVAIDGDMLRIAGEKKTEREENERGYRLSERSYGRFERHIRLPGAAKSDKVRARSSNGVLTVTVPKDIMADSSAHRIAVE
jgi:HSP20 family protein